MSNPIADLVAEMSKIKWDVDPGAYAEEDENGVVTIYSAKSAMLAQMGRGVWDTLAVHPAMREKR